MSKVITFYSFKCNNVIHTSNIFSMISGSGLFGMPPIPDIGQPLVPTKVARLTTDTPVLFGKPVTNAPAPATGLFGSTTKPSSTSASQDTFKSVTFSNPFSNSSPAGVSPQNICKLTPAVQASNTRLTLFKKCQQNGTK